MPEPIEPKPPSIWNYKPWWCQPWSIVLTGVGLIGGSWALLHKGWITGLVAVPIVLWMGFFLILYPKAMVQSSMLEPLPPIDEGNDAESGTD